jgi:hypothetical protein
MLMFQLYLHVVHLLITKLSQLGHDWIIVASKFLFSYVILSLMYKVFFDLFSMLTVVIISVA